MFGCKGKHWLQFFLYFLYRTYDQKYCNPNRKNARTFWDHSSYTFLLYNRMLRRFRSTSINSWPLLESASCHNTCEAAISCPSSSRQPLSRGHLDNLAARPTLLLYVCIQLVPCPRPLLRRKFRKLWTVNLHKSGSRRSMLAVAFH